MKVLIIRNPLQVSMMIFLLPFLFSFHDFDIDLKHHDVFDSSLVKLKNDKPVRVEILFNTYNEYNLLDKNELVEKYNNELTRNGFDVIKEKGDAVDITIKFGIVIKFDESCDKYYSVYLIEATEYTGYKFDFESGPHLNMFSDIGEVMTWLENNFIANVNTMKKLYIGE